MMRSFINWLNVNYSLKEQRDMIRRTLVLIYLAIGLMTFGQNAAYHPIMEIERVVDRTTNDTIFVDSVAPATGLKAAFAGLVWPLYWTWEGAVWLRGDVPGCKYVRDI